MIYVDVGYEFRDREHGAPPTPCYRLYREDGEVFYRSTDLRSTLEEGRRAATERGREQIEILPGRQGELELRTRGGRSARFDAEHLPTDWEQYAASWEFPHGPARSVGANPGERGPSAMGPGRDQPGLPGEVDEQDAAGMVGGAMATP